MRALREQTDSAGAVGLLRVQRRQAGGGDGGRLRLRRRVFVRALAQLAVRQETRLLLAEKTGFSCDTNR